MAGKMKKRLAGSFESSSPDQTVRLARRLARELAPGSVVALVGPLGSGKTLFVKGLARELGVSPSSAVSPTFTLINEYGGKVPLIHVDLYRLEHPGEVAELGLEEYFEGPGIVAVEWAERALPLLPGNTVTVRFERLGPRRRRISVLPPS